MDAIVFRLTQTGENMRKKTASIKEVRFLVQDAWEDAVKHLEKINELKLNNVGYNLLFEVEKIKNINRYNVVIKPIILKFRDKKFNKNIVIVVEGYIIFDNMLKNNIFKNSNKKLLQAIDYKTYIEIYKESTDEIEWSHIFGARYEFDKKNLNHPFFHVHITDEMKLFNKNKGLIQSALGSKKFCKPENRICGIHDEIRIPTAQSDFFSVLVQICADHMLPRQMNKIENYSKEYFDEINENFHKLIDSCNFFNGIEIKFVNQKPKNSNCLRSTHWYF